MLVTGKRRAALAAAAGLATVALALTGCSPSSGGSGDGDNAKVTLSFLIDNSDNTVSTVKGLVDDFTKANPNITIKAETRPQGTDGDNIIKTRLATGEMTDIFWYNSGSLFQATNPKQNLVELGDDVTKNILPSFLPTVSADGKAYGVPVGGAMGGGILYNKKVYADLGLTVPTTWAAFMDNNAKIKAAGKTPVIQTYKDTWTSQLMVLGDFANITAQNPKWADEYTKNKVKYATDTVARAGFDHLEQLFKAGDFNADFGSATLDQGLQMLVTGAGVQYPILTFVISTIKENYPDQLNDIGFFAIPGTDAAKNAMTTWMPAGIYLSKTSKHAEAAKKFLAFVASVPGCDSQTNAVGVTGPYLVKDCTLPDDVPTAVSDMLPYFEKEGANAPALEFLSPIKGPSLENITVAVGSGITSAKEGASQYDADVVKQGQQLGLPGW